MDHPVGAHRDAPLQVAWLLLDEAEDIAALETCTEAWIAGSQVERLPVVMYAGDAPQAVIIPYASSITGSMDKLLSSADSAIMKA